MADLTHRTPPKISGVPEGSRASRRIKPRAGGPSEHIAPKLRRLPSIAVSWIVAQPCIALLCAFMVLLGLFVTKVLIQIDAVQRADERFPAWLAGHRTAFLTSASYYGSMIGDAPVLIPVVATVGLRLVLSRRWRTASFILQAGMAAITCYAVTVYFITRTRPDVVRLDTFNIHHSFPSGHTAASTAIYCSIGLLLAAHFKALPLRVAIWSIAILIPVSVGLSRIYRGEHHPIDVMGGALMGLGAILVALFAVRTARAVAELRAEKNSGETFA